MQFPIQFTFDHISKMADARDHFSWDETMDEEDLTFLDIIEDYSTAYHQSPTLGEYLENIGYVVRDKMIHIRNEAALLTAHALFNQIMAEYDDPDATPVSVTLYGHTWDSTATWALFKIFGDDSVDYCGSQPSCLTSLLITHLDKEA